MTSGRSLRYNGFHHRSPQSVPRRQSFQMASILPTSPVHSVVMKDFHWNCRYPRNGWFIGGVRWLSQQMSAPRPIVICGPSGSGKSTLLKYLMAEFGDCFGFSVSHTTRKPRPGETHGKEYNFVDHSEMEKAIANGEFLEFTEFSGNIYGTSKSAVHSIQDQGRICILDIEIDGVRNIKKTDLNPRYVFIKPPSLKVLEQRLRSRGTESEESIKKRLARAREELMYGETSGNFDTVIINDDAKEAYKQLKLFLFRDIEELKKRREEKKQIEEKKKIEEQKMLEQKKKNEH